MALLCEGVVNAPLPKHTFCSECSFKGGKFFSAVKKTHEIVASKMPSIPLHQKIFLAARVLKKLFVKSQQLQNKFER